MASSGHASKTVLAGVDIVTSSGSNGSEKNEVIIQLSGEGIDLAAAQSVLSAKDNAFTKEFPDAEIKKTKSGFIDRLSISVPMGGDFDAPSATEIAKKLADVTECGLDLRYQVNAKEPESDPPTFLPEVSVILNYPDASNSLLGRSAMGIVEKRFEAANNEGVFAECLGERSGDGTRFLIQHASEESVSRENAIELASVMAYQFRQKINFAPRNIRMSSMEAVPIESNASDGNPVKKPEPGLCITLKGSDEEVERAARAIGTDGDLRLDSIPADKGKNNAMLLVNGPAESEMDTYKLLSKVHLYTGCRLPVQLSASISVAQNDNSSPATRSYHDLFRPNVRLSFNSADTEYSDLFIDALTKYVSSHVHKEGDIFALTQSKTDLKAPRGIVLNMNFESARKAQGEAANMVSRLQGFLQLSASQSLAK